MPMADRDASSRLAQNRHRSKRLRAIPTELAHFCWRGVRFGVWVYPRLRRGVTATVNKALSCRIVLSCDSNCVSAVDEG